ncbi:MAG: glycosyltransferase family 2 protein [Chloroflexi bacterium]|nr:glycosyltransferase family 2 protein [Chloroflexota bacterium]
MTEVPPKLADDILPAISIIIVNWNGKDFLPVCLSSLAALDYPQDKVEVIMVDNASTDGSQKYIRANFPAVKIIRMDKNYGFCKPNNEGAKAAAGEYLVFLNNDTEVNTGWLRELVRPALKDADVISVASKMLYYDRRDTINTAGGKITIIGGGFYRGYGAKDCPAYNEPGYTGFGCAAGVLVKKDFFLSIGGFDEDHFASCEEQDLGWKAWLYGYKVAYAPDAVMFHRESGTFGTRSNADAYKVFLNTRNHLFNIVKNLDGGNMWRGMLINFCFNLYRWANYLLSGNFAAAWAVCRAHFSFLKFLDKMLNKRKIVQKSRKRSDAELYRLGVIATFKESLEAEKLLRLLAKGSYYKA